MKKTLLLIILSLIILVTPDTTQAAEPSILGVQTAGSSAVLQTKQMAQLTEFLRKENVYLKKRAAIKSWLEKNNSPMAGSVDGFIETCRKYEIDCYLLPAIAGLESTYGKHVIPDYYNPFGWGSGRIKFESWEAGIDAVGKGLRNNYMNKGAETVEQIAPIYAASPTWAPRVRLIMSYFEREEEKNALYFSSDRVQL